MIQLVVVKELLIKFVEIQRVFIVGPALGPLWLNLSYHPALVKQDKVLESKGKIFLMENFAE